MFQICASGIKSEQTFFLIIDTFDDSNLSILSIIIDIIPNRCKRVCGLDVPISERDR